MAFTPHPHRGPREGTGRGGWSGSPAGGRGASALWSELKVGVAKLQGLPRTSPEYHLEEGCHILK